MMCLFVIVVVVVVIVATPVAASVLTAYYKYKFTEFRSFSDTLICNFRYEQKKSEDTLIN